MAARPPDHPTDRPPDHPSARPPEARPPEARLLPDGTLAVRRPDGLLILAPWDGALRGAWVTENGTHRPFLQSVILFDRRGVWLWPGPLLCEHPRARGMADVAAFFSAIPVAPRLGMADRPVEIAFLPQG
ncbi:hypothetical protein [Roseospirillum parvum]|uniref:Uncharacterized protein n=1 Tax=Roseospirillum parvum TaxID=83401 RepID=A0A1G8EE12_9PROT|nr:hypothetical protein [Roseospirillum parvum]SDH68145.1 hypothetical protein SAMN05421742_11010 [Roseospirillum parvum]